MNQNGALCREQDAANWLAEAFVHASMVHECCHSSTLSSAHHWSTWCLHSLWSQWVLVASGYLRQNSDQW